MNIEQMEIVLLCPMPGLRRDSRQHGSIRICFRDGDTSELELGAGAIRHQARIYVLGAGQYAGLNKMISLPPTIGIVIIDDNNSSFVFEQSTRILGYVKQPYSAEQLMFELSQAAEHLLLSLQNSILKSVLSVRDMETQAINDVAHALTSQPSSDDLIKLILSKAVQLSHSDTGFFLLKENVLRSHEGMEKVRFLRKSSTRFVQKSRMNCYQNIRLAPNMFDAHTSELLSTVTNMATGLSWSHGEPYPIYVSKNRTSLDRLLLPDLLFNESEYQLRSYCIFPIRTPSAEVVGHLLLINRRLNGDVKLDHMNMFDQFVTAYSVHDLQLLEALASQAAVAIDHTRLYQDLKLVFESFVQASVVAIESRDPTTRGHSDRVAVLTVSLAEAVNRVYDGPYANIKFDTNQLYELKYAALLHDFGKIGVREDVLRKEKKLYPPELDRIRSRFDYFEHQLQIRCLEAYLEGLMRRQEIPTAEGMQKIKDEIATINREFQEFWKVIIEANEPHVVKQNEVQKIADMAAVKILLGTEQKELLTDYEIQRLTLRKGSLSVEERLEIESHVTHSFKFLTRIPWTNDLANIPDIVFAHHERLDGSGYPRNLTSDEIPIQAKIMAITDIYDALVAMDRPYKKALPPERALQILECEVKEGKLDPVLFKLFIDAKIFEAVNLDQNTIIKAS